MGIWKGMLTPSRSLLALRYGSLLLPIIAALVWGWMTYRHETASTHARTQENAALVRQYAERLVQTQTILQTAAQRHVAGRDPGYLRTQEFHAFLAALEGTQSISLGLVVLDPTGEVIASSRSFPLNTTFGPRDYITGVLDGADPFVDRLTLEPSGDDGFIIAKPFRAAGFDGVIASAMAATSITGFLHNIATQRGEVAVILREDGQLLAMNADAVPVRLPQDAPAMLAIANAASGTFVGHAVFDRVERLHAFDRVGELPIYAHFGTPLAGITNRWLARAAPVWALFGAIGLFSFAMSVQIDRALAARIEAEVRAKRLDAAERLAAQRTGLMKEMNHRIKNNLSLVVSLIGMQMRTHGSLDAHELKSRIQAIVEVHDLMYRAEDGVNVDFGQMLNEICTSPAIVPRESGITMDCDVEPGIMVCPDRATPLALIAAELVTNAVKHAFVGPGAGSILVRLRRRERDTVFEVRDDGVGIPPETVKSSGRAIVSALVDQIGGTLQVACEGGVHVLITFPHDERPAALA